MQTKNISIGSENLKEIRALQSAAFPKAEQYPFPVLLLISLQKSVKYTAYYDGENFCGISLCAYTDEVVYVLYLAVCDNLRSSGYGTKILDMIKSEANGRTLCLCVEPLDETAENYEQRKRRYAFYFRNDFYDTGYLVKVGTESYAVLASGGSFSQEGCEEAISRLSFRIFHPELVKAHT